MSWTYQPDRLKLAKKPKAIDKQAEARAKERQWQTVKAEVRLRDGGICRLCSERGVDCHHVTYRSRGGKNETCNTVLLCRRHHQEVHDGLVKLAGNASDAKGLRVARWSEKDTDFVWQARTV